MPSSSTSSSNLPVGWEDRNNQMSEHDMKLGGIAADKFSNKNKATSAYDGSGTMTYKNSDEVKKHYMSLIEAEEKEKQESAATKASSLPFGWEERQKSNAIGEKQHGVFAKHQNSPSITSNNSSNEQRENSIKNKEYVGGGAELALVQVATNTLDTLAKTLEQQPANIPMEHRAAFAAAMKRAMDALAKCPKQS